LGHKYAPALSEICLGLEALNAVIPMGPLCSSVGTSIAMNIREALGGNRLVELTQCDLAAVLTWSSTADGTNPFSIIPRQWLTTPLVDVSGNCGCGFLPIAYMVTSNVLSKRAAEWYIKCAPETLWIDRHMCRWFSKHHNSGADCSAGGFYLLKFMEAHQKRLAETLAVGAFKSPDSPLALMDSTLLCNIVKLTTGDM
jgi:hypothetical protein